MKKSRRPMKNVSPCWTWSPPERGRAINSCMPASCLRPTPRPQGRRGSMPASPMPSTSVPAPWDACASALSRRAWTRRWATSRQRRASPSGWCGPASWSARQPGVRTAGGGRGAGAGVFRDKPPRVAGRRRTRRPVDSASVLPRFLRRSRMSCMRSRMSTGSRAPCIAMRRVSGRNSSSGCAPVGNGGWGSHRRVTAVAATPRPAPRGCRR